MVERPGQADERSRSGQAALYPESPIRFLGDCNLVAGVESKSAAQRCWQNQPTPLIQARCPTDGAHVGDHTRRPTCSDRGQYAPEPIHPVSNEVAHARPMDTSGNTVATPAEDLARARSGSRDSSVRREASHSTLTAHRYLQRLTRAGYLRPPNKTVAPTQSTNAMSARIPLMSGEAWLTLVARNGRRSKPPPRRFQPGYAARRSMGSIRRRPRTAVLGPIVDRIRVRGCSRVDMSQREE